MSVRNRSNYPIWVKSEDSDEVIKLEPGSFRGAGQDGIAIPWLKPGGLLKTAGKGIIQAYVIVNNDDYTTGDIGWVSWVEKEKKKADWQRLFNVANYQWVIGNWEGVVHWNNGPSLPKSSSRLRLEIDGDFRNETFGAISYLDDYDGWREGIAPIFNLEKYEAKISLFGSAPLNAYVDVRPETNMKMTIRNLKGNKYAELTKRK